MKTIGLGVAACCLLVNVTCMAADRELAEFVKERVAEVRDIPPARRETLAKLADYIRSQRETDKPIRLTFVCTHNSRRSQMAQVWAVLAAAHYGVDGFMGYSGGTEQTAFNPRAVAALKRAGVNIEPRLAVADGENVRYAVAVQDQEKPLVCFSKVYNQPPNPESDFAAVMTCSEADKNCPSIPGADIRIALPYDDPKTSDGTPREAQAYDDRCRQIAREMFYLFSLL
jgi:arsenate reductase (thioredoxin)